MSSDNRNNRIVLNPNTKNNKLPAPEQNFLFKSCKIWITFAKDIFEKYEININRWYIITGEEANSDPSASSGVARGGAYAPPEKGKARLKKMLVSKIYKL